MPDTIRSEAALLANFPDNIVKAITPQNLRDFVVSVYDAKLDTGALTSHLADSTNPHAVTSAQTAFTPVGDIAATTASAAIIEVNNKIDANLQVVPFTDLYVAVGVGSDAAAGTTTATPLATLDEAVRRLNLYSVVKDQVVIHLNSGTHNFTAPVLPHILQNHIVFYGDGAGQVGDDGQTELATGIVDTGSTGAEIVTSTAGFTLNQYQGKTLEFTSGPLTGYRRTIRYHTPTVFQLSQAAFDGTLTVTTGVATSGTTFKIFSTAVNVAVTGLPLSLDYNHLGVDLTMPGVVGCRGAAGNGHPFSTLCGVAFQVIFVNMKFVGHATSPYGILNLAFSSVAMFGVSVNEVIDGAAGVYIATDDSSVFFAGAQTSSYTNVTYIGETLGGQAGLSWSGWGLTSENGLSFSRGSFVGHYVSTVGPLAWYDCRVAIFGGHSYSSSADGAQFTHSSGHVFSFLTRASGTADGLKCNALYVSACPDINFASVIVEKTGVGTAFVAESDNSGQGGNPSFASFSSCTFRSIGAQATTAVVVAGGCQVSFAQANVFEGFLPGTELAVRMHGVSGELVEQCSYTDLNSYARVLPTITDGRHGFIRRIT